MFLYEKGIDSRTKLQKRIDPRLPGVGIDPTLKGMGRVVASDRQASRRMTTKVIKMQSVRQAGRHQVDDAVAQLWRVNG